MKERAGAGAGAAGQGEAWCCRCSGRVCCHGLVLEDRRKPANELHECRKHGEDASASQYELYDHTKRGFYLESST